MADSQISKKLTIVTTTHLIPSAPSTWVIRRTIQSLRKTMPVKGCEHLVYYDAPEVSDARDAQYQENLQKLADELQLKLLVRRRSGLKSNYLNAIDTASTPYMLFLEHDWVFRRKVKLSALLDVFDKYPFVNLVKFNKFANDSHLWWDHLVEAEDRIPELPLTRTSCWTNNPHVVRIEKWQNSWRKIVGEHKEQGAAGIEEKLYPEYCKAIFTNGFREANNEWGCFIYGAITDPALIYHINGSLSKHWFLEPFAKIVRRIVRLVKHGRFGY